MGLVVLVVNAVSQSFDLALAVAVLPGARAAVADAAGGRPATAAQARAAFEEGPALVAHAAMTAQRLGLSVPSRTSRLLDVLELFAFVRPALFCAPSAAGLAIAMGLDAPKTVVVQARSIRAVAQALLAELADHPTPGRAEALAQAEVIARAGWAWGPAVLAALRSGPTVRRWRGDGLDVWNRIGEWEDQAPPGDPGSKRLDPAAVEVRLTELLERSGLYEPRPTQATFARETAHAFQPREREGEPMMMLAEAGTGVGKTLAYLASASCWAEQNGPGVWISTYTRALQRQIERESQSVFPEPAAHARKVVVRKGRENYLCLLNLQEAMNIAARGGGDMVGLGLTARWVAASRDGDMTGGDFPAWLPNLFNVAAPARASALNLVDRRGECLHAACLHHRACFIEKSVRASRQADLVIANHALVLTQAAVDGARAAHVQKDDGQTSRLRRIVFDEGHHLFDAADNAFAAVLSGAEAAELRRWIRGPEGPGRRGRGLAVRLKDVLGDQDAALQSLQAAIRAAASLPGDGWSARIAPGAGDLSPTGPIEVFLVSVLEQLRARTSPSDTGMECPTRPAPERVRDAARAAAAAINALEQPLLDLSRHMADRLDADADTLQTVEKSRIEGVLRGLDRRARMMLPAWRSMLVAIDNGAEDDPEFVDWFEATFLCGRIVDVVCRRHWVDPTEPLAATVIVPAHGILVTSATLADSSLADPFALAEMRTGAARLPERPKTLRLKSPFDYGANAVVLVVNDVSRDDPRQVAAAMRELFLAAGGGGLGVFTAINRLRAVHARIAGPLADRGLSLLAQHVDPLEVGALVDIFRAETDSCLLGTDAVRDGVDVPGRALRLLVFDRVPWPRPDILHRARRSRFGGKSYDDIVTRGRIAQAFGRLIRKSDDKGVFVMLDPAAPTRLFTGLPEGARLERVSLVEAVEATAAHVG